MPLAPKKIALANKSFASVIFFTIYQQILIFYSKNQ